MEEAQTGTGHSVLGWAGPGKEGRQARPEPCGLPRHLRSGESRPGRLDRARLSLLMGNKRSCGWRPRGREDPGRQLCLSFECTLSDVGSDPTVLAAVGTG